MIPGKNAALITSLQTDILRLQGFSTLSSPVLDTGLGPLKEAFPNASFPLGCVHEFLSSQIEDLAPTGGFITGLLSTLMGGTGITLWISASRTLFPPALKPFGINPDRFIFIDLRQEKEVVWAMEEALKCGSLAAVVAEMKEISFTESRRLQLAVEQSKVSGFIIRNHSKLPGTTACVSRWKITSLPSEPIEDLPGLGLPSWRVELLRMRNGKPGAWNLKWNAGKFQPLDSRSSSQESNVPNEKAIPLHVLNQKAG